ncbi:hypothetical protein DUNSADRAFT_18629 [Dunaliella salina]|uniref:Uncharacterized protein n=1 Tax=Dunaliella salina TaxID=3046 RepID=A0ABQ7FZQ7_DUNSA|nr:hypothetical protein DUNSADRAFT_18629 [Dunaliella salina]|eukprot:KAF5827839.1 hypothetical protein DUNSADRAFT_18629 [Dunaliella salina]
MSPGERIKGRHNHNTLIIPTYLAPGPLKDGITLRPSWTTQMNKLQNLMKDTNMVMHVLEDLPVLWGSGNNF